MSELISLKIIVVGNGTVGKSSLSQRFAKGNFTSEYKKTLGVDFLSTKRNIMDNEIEFLIWDTAGQEYYDSITRRYYKGANAAIIVFAVDNLESFNSVEKWKDKITSECGKIPIYLVMNKIDLENHIVKQNDLEKKSQQIKVPYYTISVKENKNVEILFQNLAQDVIKSGSYKKDNTENDINNNNLIIDISEEDNKKKIVKKKFC